MKEYQSLAHTKWDRKYHVVFMHPEEVQESDFWGNTQTSWYSIT